MIIKICSDFNHIQYYRLAPEPNKDNQQSAQLTALEELEEHPGVSLCSCLTACFWEPSSCSALSHIFQQHIRYLTAFSLENNQLQIMSFLILSSLYVVSYILSEFIPEKLLFGKTSLLYNLV